MKRYFTSDWHINSNTVLKIAERPFVDAHDAFKTITNNCNKIASKCDTIIHVGDFYLDGSDNHNKELVDSGSDISFDNLTNSVKANITLLSGNHDDGHNCSTTGICLLINLNSRYKNVTVGHYPSASKVSEQTIKERGISHKHIEGYQGLYGDKYHIHVHICGHVHQHWLIGYDHNNRVLNINVGVDCWNYNIVSDAEIIELLNYIFDNAKFYKSWTMNREEFESWKKENIQRRAIKRKTNKELKLKKKGLTKEECERRKQEGLNAYKLEKIKKLNSKT